MIGMVRSHITEKGVDGGEPDIPRRYRVIAILLQMCQKRQYPVGLKVLDVQVAHIDPSIRSDEAKQKHQAVAIAVNGVRAHSTKSG
jgi:hypothetical protein